ncbi:MAG: SDR family NAD(P)-dependent oxidoreductase [Caulobacterales bacterium]
MVQAHGENKAQLLALGFGYSARALAARLRPTWNVIGTSTRGGDDTLMFDGAFASPELEAVYVQADAILISIPPDAHGCPAFRAFEDTLCTARWIGYLSTTGVYGDRDGRWCFEWTPPRPGSAVSANRVTAEKQWATRGGHAFRLAGIYGPGRCALDRVRAGDVRRVIKPGQVFSRIHVDDIAAALACSLARPEAQGPFNLCDDDPAPPQDVLSCAAELLHVDLPAPVDWLEAGLSPQALRFYQDNRRVSNARTKARLGWRPLYPSYRDGLAALLKDGF